MCSVCFELCLAILINRFFFPEIYLIYILLALFCLNVDFSSFDHKRLLWNGRCIKYTHKSLTRFHGTFKFFYIAFDTLFGGCCVYLLPFTRRKKKCFFFLFNNLCIMMKLINLPFSMFLFLISIERFSIIKFLETKDSQLWAIEYIRVERFGTRYCDELNVILGMMGYDHRNGTSDIRVDQNYSEFTNWMLTDQ